MLIAGNTMAWFTDEATVSDTTYTAGTVNIEADRIISGTGGQRYFEKFHYCVKSFNQKGLKGKKAFTDCDLNDILSILTNLDPVYIRQRGNMSFYTLGCEGTITLRLSNPLPAGNGTRGIRYKSGGSSDGVEQAMVEVSADCRNWIELPDRMVKSPQITEIIIPDSVNIAIQYIRITDIEPEEETYTYDMGVMCCPPPNPPPCPPPKYDDCEGFELDFMEIGIAGEGNWTPGDSSCIDYLINNTGSKNIMLRVKLTGVWQQKVCGEWRDTGLPVTNVMITPTGSSAESWNSWIPSLQEPGVQYLEYIYTLAGSYNGQTPGFAELHLMVTLLGGPATGPEYQGCRFVLMPEFEAIQASHSNGVDGDYGWTWDNYHIYN
jgi:predicted ribosomally synthesized peptide with SipW-like signal peptide